MRRARGVDDLSGVCVGEAQGEAELRAVGAGREVCDAERSAWCAEDGARRRHAIEHRENFELGLELVGDEVDGEVRVADSVFDGGGEMERAGGCFGCEAFLSAAEARGHYVFEDDVEACADAAQCEIAACGSCTDDRDAAQLAERLHGWAVTLQ